MKGPRFTIEGVTATWDVLLSDGQVLASLPVVGEEMRPGKGPGDLEWRATVDADVPGLRATWPGGAFVILRVSTGKCALFHERRPGDFTALAVGGADELKLHASARCAPPSLPPPSPSPPRTRQQIAAFLRLWKGR